MKKYLLTALATIVYSMAMSAADFDGMTFEYADGSTKSVSVDELSITPSVNSLMVSSKAGTFDIPMAQLKKFYFISDYAGINSPIVDESNTDVEIYTISGIKAGSFASKKEAEATLPSGLYIMKSNGQTLKIAVK